MLARRSGHIVDVASIAADFVAPPRVLYSASKAFVQTFSRGLYRELRGTGVRVSVINPGPVRTEFRRVASGLPVEERPELEQGVAPEQVAAAIIATIQRPRRSTYVPGIAGLARSSPQPWGRSWIASVEASPRGGSESWRPDHPADRLPGGPGGRRPVADDRPMEWVGHRRLASTTSSG